MAPYGAFPLSRACRDAVIAARKWPRSWSAIIKTLRCVREVMAERLFCRENQRQPLHSGRERDATLHRIALSRGTWGGLEALSAAVPALVTSAAEQRRSKRRAHGYQKSTLPPLSHENYIPRNRPYEIFFIKWTAYLAENGRQHGSRCSVAPSDW